MVFYYSYDTISWKNDEISTCYTIMYVPLFNIVEPSLVFIFPSLQFSVFVINYFHVHQQTINTSNSSVYYKIFYCREIRSHDSFIFNFLEIFSFEFKLLVSLWNLGYNKSPRVTKTLLSIPIDFYCVVVRIVSNFFNLQGTTVKVALN